MKQLSRSDKAKKWVENYILPSLMLRDLDYDKVIDGLTLETGISKKNATDILESFINLGEMKLLKVLSVSDKNIINSLIKIDKNKQDLALLDSEMARIEAFSKKGVK